MSFIKKNVSVLNIDIDGFSKIYYSLGAEQTAEAMNDFYSQLSEIAEENRGLVLEFLGDGFIAMFSNENSYALDAVKAALAMQKKICDMNREYSEKQYPDIHAAIVVTSGEALAGNFGKGSYERYNAIGDAINASFSIGHKAKGDQLLINEATYLLVKDSVVVKEEVEISRRHHDDTFKCYDIRSLS